MHRVLTHRLRPEYLRALRRQQLIDTIQVLQVNAVRTPVEGLGQVVTYVCVKHPPCRERPRTPGNDHFPNAELPSQPDGVHGAGAPEGHEREVTRIDPL